MEIMFLNRLLLTHFKNYDFQDIALSPGFNCFFGHNGMGKTNLLDAVYFLCMTKSHFGLPDSAVIQWENEFMRLEGPISHPKKNKNPGTPGGPLRALVRSYRAVAHRLHRSRRYGIADGRQRNPAPVHG